MQPSVRLPAADTYGRTCGGAREAGTPFVRIIGMSGETHGREVAGTREPKVRNQFCPPIRFILTGVDVTVTVTNAVRTVVKLRMYCNRWPSPPIWTAVYYVIRNAESSSTRLYLSDSKCRVY